MESKYREGDILKKDITSRESWIVYKFNGELVAVPILNSHCPDGKEIPLKYFECINKNPFIKIASAKRIL